MTDLQKLQFRVVQQGVQSIMEAPKFLVPDKGAAIDTFLASQGYTVDQYMRQSNLASAEELGLSLTS